MSISHSFWVTKVETFKDDLIEAVQGFIKKNNNKILQSIIEKDLIVVSFKDSLLYISTIERENKAYPLSIGGSLFTFTKYNRGANNILFCKLALICKYYLKENLVIKSDGFYCGIDYDWQEACKQLKSEGYNIEVDYDLNNNEEIFIINGNPIKNEFDKEGKLFNIVFKKMGED